MKACSIALVVSLAVVACCQPEKGAQVATSGADSGSRDTLTVLMTGDIMLDRGVRRVIERHGADHLFGPDIDSLLASAQVVVGNLECPATHIVAPVQKRFVFRADPEWLETLRRHGFTHLNLANNHSIDQGRRGLTDTWQNIARAGMVPVGAGEDMAQAARPVMVADSPRRVWMVASLRLALENYAYLTSRPCVSQTPIDSVAGCIRRLKADDPRCVVVVSLHWGAEHTTRPVPAQRLEAHMLVDAGADALVCHHTHTLQSIENYRGRTIFYSTGNFIFDQQQPLNTRACVARLVITADTVEAQAVPIEIDRCVPHLTRDKKETNP